MKVNRKDNWRVELEVEQPWGISAASWGVPQSTIDKKWQIAADDIAAQVRRHVDGVEHVLVRYDSHIECSLCGRDWETEAGSGQPVCCNAAVAEWQVS